MKGYFSQLARNTGLRFTSGADSLASRTKTVAPATPLHVEEEAMVSPTPPIAAVSTGDEPAAQISAGQKFNVAQPETNQSSSPLLEPSTANNQVTARGDERPRAELQPVEYGAPQVLATEQPITFTGPTFDTNRAATTEDDKAENIQTVEVELASHASPLGPKTAEVLAPSQTFTDHKPESAAQNSSDVEFDEPAEREVLVRQYLREVREWVAASPTTDDSVSETQSSTDPQTESVAFAVERDSISARPQPESRDSVDVHDMNLSIGSISVVIEDPKPAAAAVIAPANSAPSTQPQTHHEPISLSRYYLRSW